MSGVVHVLLVGSLSQFSRFLSQCEEKLVSRDGGCKLALGVSGNPSLFFMGILGRNWLLVQSGTPTPTPTPAQRQSTADGWMDGWKVVHAGFEYYFFI